jgi:hypothetical protein
MPEHNKAMIVIKQLTACAPGWHLAGADGKVYAIHCWALSDDGRVLPVVEGAGMVPCEDFEFLMSPEESYIYWITTGSPPDDRGIWGAVNLSETEDCRAVLWRRCRHGVVSG